MRAQDARGLRGGPGADRFALEQEHATLGPGDSVFIDAHLVHATFNDGAETAHLHVVLGPALDSEAGYGLVDVSGEEPWSSLR